MHPPFFVSMISMLPVGITSSSAMLKRMGTESALRGLPAAGLWPFHRASHPDGPTMPHTTASGKLRLTWKEWWGEMARLLCEGKMKRQQAGHVRM
jgi:hypothetical protein